MINDKIKYSLEKRKRMPQTTKLLSNYEFKITQDVLRSYFDVLEYLIYRSQKYCTNFSVAIFESEDLKLHDYLYNEIRKSDLIFDIETTHASIVFCQDTLREDGFLFANRVFRDVAMKFEVQSGIAVISEYKANKDPKEFIYNILDIFFEFRKEKHKFWVKII